MTLTVQDRMLIEQRVTNEGPNTTVAYLFWISLGGFGAHRYYLGRPGMTVLQFLSLFILVGFVWVLIDAFLIPGMVRSKHTTLRERLARQIDSGGLGA